MAKEAVALSRDLMTRPRIPGGRIDAAERSERFEQSLLTVITSPDVFLCPFRHSPTPAMFRSAIRTLAPTMPSLRAFSTTATLLKSLTSAQVAASTFPASPHVTH